MSTSLTRNTIKLDKIHHKANPEFSHTSNNNHVTKCRVKEKEIVAMQNKSRDIELKHATKSQAHEKQHQKQRKPERN